MSTTNNSNPFPLARCCAAGWLLALCLAVFAAGPVPLSAQEPPEPPEVTAAPAVPQTEQGADDAGEATEEAAEMAVSVPDDLRDRLLDRYQALPARDGILLVPRENVPGISSIEVSDGEVVVNGEAVSPTILRSWLGDEAEPLLALATLDAEAGRDLLAVDVTASAPPLVTVSDGEAEETDDGEDRERRERRRAASDDEDRSWVRLGEQFKVGGELVIEENEEATEAVVIGGSILVRGRVRRDVVAVGGSVRIEGSVGGEVVSVPGGVFLGPDSEVSGNITAVGGGVNRDRGADIGGEVTEVTVPGASRGLDLDEWVEGRSYRGNWLRQWQIDEAYWSLVFTALLVLLACLAYFIARGPVERVELRLRRGSEWWTSGAVGLLVFLLTIPVLLIIALALILTIVGCLALPLLPFVLLVLVVVGFFGYVGVALRLGRWLEGRMGWSLKSPYAALVIGVVLLEIWTVIGEALDIFGGPVWIFASMFLLVGFVVEWGAAFVGLGAILMNWIEGRRGNTTPPPPLPPHAPAPAGGYGDGSGGGYGSAMAATGAAPSAPPVAPPAAPAAATPAAPPAAPPSAQAPMAPDAAAESSGAAPSPAVESAPPPEPPPGDEPDR